MALKSRDYFTIVEFGTSKICALHGGSDKGGTSTVFGSGSRDSNGCIVKGEIVDLQAAIGALSGALEDADNSAGNTFDRERVYYLVSGRGITSRQGEGNVMLYGPDRLITDEHVEEAVGKASSISLAPDQMHLESFASYYMLDMNTRVKDPVGHSANRLDAFIHIILAERNRLNTMRTAIRELGFEQEIVPVFAGIASAYGTLTHDEKEQGTLLIDIGAGTTDYIFVHDEGVFMSGVLPVGMDNLVNDLAVGLDLTQEQARRFLLEGKIDQLKRSGEAFLRLPVSSELFRNIPVGSFEKITELRLNEIFGILRQELDARKLSPYMNGGVVVTGGGAKIPAVLECARGVLRTHVRKGDPLEFSGAVTGLDDPRYAANFRAKLSSYEKAGYYLNDRLIVTRDENGTVDLERVRRFIQSYSFQKVKE